MFELIPLGYVFAVGNRFLSNNTTNKTNFCSLFSEENMFDMTGNNILIFAYN